jgi:hypothetical protein
MNKKILITLLLITSLLLFLGCANLGIEVTCPNGEIVTDITECVEDDSDGTPTDPELKDGETVKASQSQTCVPIWTEATYPRRVIALPAWHSMNYECSSCNSRYTNAGMRDCCSTEQRIVVYETPGDISSPFIHIKGAWCQIQYGPPSAPPQPPANHPYCERCYGNATTNDSSKCFDPKTGGNGNVSGWTEVNCDILSSRGTTCADSSCATTCAANDGDSANCSSGSNPNSLRNCNRASGDHRIEGFKCECACSPESDSGTIPPRPDFTGTAKIAVTFSEGVDTTYNGMKIIYDCDDLQAMSHNLTGDYILGNDIDCTETSRGMSDFEPVGTSNSPFTGTFNGNKQEITGVYIHIFDRQTAGLFGAISENALIKNVGLVDNEIIISTESDVAAGGLVGHMYSGTVTNNYVVGIIRETDSLNATTIDRYTGGLIGRVNSGSITKNRVNGEVTGSAIIGGLIAGLNSGTVKNNYISGIQIGDNIAGGLVGTMYGGEVTNNYTIYENQIGSGLFGTLVGRTYGDGIVSNNFSVADTSYNRNLIGEVVNENNIVNNYGVNEVSTFGFSESYWLPFGILAFDESWIHINNNLPELTSQLCPKYSGLQELNGKKVVCSCEDLQNISLDISADYLIGDNLACSNTTNWNSGAGFEPIVAFTGTLIGNNNTINDLFINRPTESQVGLFASIQNAKITKVTLENANIIGSTNVGAIAGRSTTSTIENTYVNGNINSTSTTQLTRTGGLIGYVTVGNTQISYSSFNGTVTSNGGAVGGIVGVLDGGAIIGSHTNGAVTGAHNYAGGITSYVNWTSSIQDSYSTASVTGRKYVGGLVGTIDKEGTNAIINCFATGAVTGTRDVGGLIGEHYRNGETITNNYYNNTADNPSNCIGAGSGECTEITNDETYFYDMTNEPMVSWVFQQLWEETTNYYPTIYKETEDFLPLTAGTAEELGEFASSLFSLEETVATAKSDEDIHCCVFQEIEQTRKRAGYGVVYNILVWKDSPNRWWNSPRMPWYKPPTSSGYTKDVCVGITVGSIGINKIISPTQNKVDRTCGAINTTYAQANVATECLKVELEARSAYFNGKFKPCRVVKVPSESSS